MSADVASAAMAGYRMSALGFCGQERARCVECKQPIPRVDLAAAALLA